MRRDLWEDRIEMDETHETFSDQQIERVARAICRSLDLDPDEKAIIDYGGGATRRKDRTPSIIGWAEEGKMWQNFISTAEMHLAADKALRDIKWEDAL